MIKAICANLNQRINRPAVIAIGSAGFFAVLGWSGVKAFERPAESVALVATEQAQAGRVQNMGLRPAPSVTLVAPVTSFEKVHPIDAAPAIEPQPRERAPRFTRPAQTIDSEAKLDRKGNVIMVNGKPWTGEVFDYRPIRKVRTRTMKTTAYSPDEKSCGKWADGITASGKSVWMNGGRLVAADRSIPYGTILTIPGYNGGKPVQVWDRGGAIKGNRLDLLYPTHEIARQWGVQDLPVHVWQFVETD